MLNDNTVCMVVYNRYSVDTRVRRAAETLVARGYQVHAICSDEAEKSTQLTIAGVRVHPVGIEKGTGANLSNLWSLIRFLLGACRLVHRMHHLYRPGIYHVHSLPDFLVFVVLWPRLNGAKIILDLHESFPEIALARTSKMPAVVKAIACWLERLSCSYADAIIVVNDRIKKLVADRGEKESRITVIMNSPGQVPKTSHPLRPEISRLLSEGSSFAVYAGGVNSERDLVTLLNSLATLKSRKVFIHLVVFTHSVTPYLRQFLSQVEEMRLGDLVTFAGRLLPEEVHGNLIPSTVGIVSYEKNPLTEIALPNKVFEYMRARVPIVAADLAVLRDFLGNSVWYYRPGDPISLAESIEACVNDDQRDMKVERLFEIYLEHSWEVMESRLRAVYDSLLRVSHRGNGIR